MWCQITLQRLVCRLVIGGFQGGAIGLADFGGDGWERRAVIFKVVAFGFAFEPTVVAVGAGELAAEHADDGGMRESVGEPIRAVLGGLGLGLDEAVLVLEGCSQAEGRRPIHHEDGFAGEPVLVIPAIRLKLLPLRRAVSGEDERLGAKHIHMFADGLQHGIG